MLKNRLLDRYKREYRQIKANMIEIKEKAEKECDPMYEAILWEYYKQHEEYAKKLKDKITYYSS